MVTYIFNTVLVILGIILVCVFLFVALVFYMMCKGIDSREKEAQELMKKIEEEYHKEGTQYS